MTNLQLKDRLKKARLEAGLTQKDIESRLDNMKQSSYSELERGVSKSTSRIVELAELFKVDANWLATGKGSMHKTVYNDGGSTINIDFKRNERLGNYVEVSQYDINEYQAVDIAVNDGSIFRRDLIRSITNSSDGLYVVFSQSNGMSPTISNGDMLLVDTLSTMIESSNIYLVEVNNKLYIRRLIDMPTHVIARCDNPDKSKYPDFTVNNVSDMTVIGKIVWVGSAM